MLLEASTFSSMFGLLLNMWQTTVPLEQVIVSFSYLLSTAFVQLQQYGTI